MNISEEDFLLEKKHLELTTNLLRENISQLAQEFYDSEEKQQEFKKIIWDSKQELDPTEMKTILSNNDKEIDDLERKAKYYKKLYKIQNSPYFGKITFEDDDGKNDIYIMLPVQEVNITYLYIIRKKLINSFFFYKKKRL